MKKLLTAILFLFFSLILSATNHYVATGGGGSGTLISPFASLTQVNAHSYAAGDSILFKGGDTFYGTLIVSQSGSSGSRIGIGRYSTGANPVITGFTTVSAWTNLGSNIWESTSAVSTLSYCNLVTVNGVNTPMGRYPNTGYLTYSSVTSTSLTSSSLNATTTDWTGATAVVREERYIIDRKPITSASGTTINYAATSYTGHAGWGFFIQNDARTLDTLNEWYYNPSTKKLKIYSTVTPTNVQVATQDTLIFMTYMNYITFDNIQ